MTMQGQTRALQDAVTGETVWLEGLGYPMAPLSQLARDAQVERCEPTALRAGDFAVVQHPNGTLAAYLVLAAGVKPQTAPFWGEPGEEIPKLLGRVTALRVGAGRRELKLGTWARLGARAAREALRLVRRSGAPRLLGSARALWEGLPPVLAMKRHRMLPLTARPLLPSDREALAAFARAEVSARVEHLDAQLLGRWQEGGIAVGAFDRHGRLCGLIYLDEYRREGLDVEGVWVRSLVVSSRARRVGVAREMSLVAEARARAMGISVLHADLRPDNTPVLKLLAYWGFRPASAADAEAFNATCKRAGLEDGWAVWNYDVPATPRARARSARR
ncbi:GNAT family N-acetyltransferase [Corallococcus sp. M34]|uniref:GNAT family N-acetyltransferase n=1 Tax=Citreicoccus inhibens TaxID=2849499 RepID=UPI0011C36647|nr:GNAT family N-acetyltransferase [Citreicoccus inhibens]MBU8894174.1 GNAT family N-acetyltransferase [Citreicoccus inhibens]